MNYYYDKEADVFYFSQGAPSTSDRTVEVGNDVLLRIHARTKSVRGFTLLNASKGTKRSGASIPVTFVPAASVGAM